MGILKRSNMSRRLKIGIYAVPFGFGPVSKAMTIAKAIKRRSSAELTFLGSGISKEFMCREKENGDVFIDTKEIDLREDVAENILSSLNGIIIVMHRPWASRLAPHMPVFCVDSLGHMWDDHYFENFPDIKHVRKYFIQNLFSSSIKVQRTEHPPIVAVQPIIDTERAPLSVFRPQYVFQLGGLLNPFGPQTTDAYVEGIAGVIKRWGNSKTLVLTSQEICACHKKTFGNASAVSLPHGETLTAMLSADFLFSAPGLTTLLEAAYLGVPMAPLPPENYSQVLNIRNLLSHYGNDLHDIWHFLNQEYKSIPDFSPEGKGVSMVAEFNKHQLTSTRFRESYMALANNACEQKSRLPKRLSQTSTGADLIAESVLIDLGSRPIFNANPHYAVRIFPGRAPT